MRVGRQFSDIFEIHNGLKQGNALSPLLFNFVLEHGIKSLEEKEGLQLNGINKLLVYADNIVLLRDNEEILTRRVHDDRVTDFFKLCKMKVSLCTKK